ncbi:MAG: nucleoside-diphosphate sugar epimerase/dehydratase [Cytophagales bacterium]
MTYLYKIFHSPITRIQVLFLDLFLCFVATLAAFLLIFDFNLPKVEYSQLILTLGATLSLKIVTFNIYKPYSGIIRFTSTEDARKIINSIGITTFILIFVNLLYYYFYQKSLFHYSVLIVDFLLSISFMAAFRLISKTVYYEYRQKNAKKRHVIIFGAGEAGVITKRTLTQYSGATHIVVAFVDDNISKSKKMIEGVTIHETSKNLKNLIKLHHVEEVIIAVPFISKERKQEIVDICLEMGAKVRAVPPVQKWINGELNINQIKEVKIDDILGRDVIKLDNKEVDDYLSNKVILVTGAAGSIGSEIARQISEFNPSLLLLLDQNETALHDLNLELAEAVVKVKYEIVLGDIRNVDRLRKVFEKYKPNIVFHAAAYKHVPMIEENPTEGILCNVKGSKNLADLAVEYGTEKFVMISTDKAVNPTNVMGASKRIAEIYTQSLGNYAGNKSTKFVTTRFGNVLGSNGSVIPRFKKQIAEGGPITVTHPEITRYFMTIPEAVQLVLEAGVMGNGGEIFIFDMGKSVKIVDLAKKMVKLSGLSLGKDIQLIFTGLRPGEKLYEELLNNSENTLPTHHPKIMKAKVQEYSFEEISKEILELILLFDCQDNYRIISKMKTILPEYKSANSIYEKLDRLKEVDLDSEAV